jgi:hypothetical protein
VNAIDRNGNAALEETALDLAAQEATGRLLVASPDGNYGWLWLRDGLLSGVSGPGPRPLLANRLATFELLPKSQISKIVVETRSRPSVRMLEVVAELGSVPPTFLHDFVAITAAEQLALLEAMPIDHVRFESGNVHRSGPAMLLVHEVFSQCRTLRTELSGVAADARFTTGRSATGPNDAVARTLTTYCDGSRDLRQLAYVSGLTQHESVVWLEAMLAMNQVQLFEADDQPFTDWETQTPLPLQDESAPMVEPRAQTAARSGEPPRPLPPPPGPPSQPAGTGQPVVRPSGPRPPDSPEGRRDLLSTLAALSAEAEARSAAPHLAPPSSDPAADREQAPLEGDAEPDTDAASVFTAATPPGGRGIASEMFRELHSLGEG